MKHEKPIKLSKISFFMIILLLSVRCEHRLEPVPAKTGDVFSYSIVTDVHNINELNDDKLFYSWRNIFPLSQEYPQDDEGVSVFIFDDEEYYHPVQLAQRTLRFLDSYRKTNEQEYLVRAESHLKRMLELGVNSNNALYFYYPFDFPLHGNEEETLKAQWYSGMAQGQALSAFVRMYKITEESVYLDIAEKIFRSFILLKKGDNPWVVFIDERHYYWIEEYPSVVPTHVLNGFIFGFYGLYDYFFEKRDDVSYKLMQASLTTLKRYLEEYRTPGGISLYCLRHKVKSPSYHNVHIRELKMLYKITGDSFFDHMTSLFIQDY